MSQPNVPLFASILAARLAQRIEDGPPGLRTLVREVTAAAHAERALRAFSEGPMLKLKLCDADLLRAAMKMGESTRILIRDDE